MDRISCRGGAGVKVDAAVNNARSRSCTILGIDRCLHPVTTALGEWMPIIKPVSLNLFLTLLFPISWNHPRTTSGFSQKALVILLSTELTFKLWRTLDKSASPFLADWVSVSLSQQRISHILHSNKPGRKSSRLKV
jgi:hypothetical protein